MKMRINKLIFPLLISLIISCNNRPMNEVNFDSPGFKMYFMNYEKFSDKTEICDFQLRYKNFYIDDLDLLNQIKNEIILNETNKNISTNCFYIVQLVNNGEIEFGCALDIENNIIENKKNMNLILKNFKKKLIFSNRWMPIKLNVTR